MKRFEQYTTFSSVEHKKTGKGLLKMLIWTGAVAVIMLFLPWTQTITSTGNVTALNPDNRPQTIHAVIGGRIEKWFVREGTFVKKGDTIAFLSETKSEYMDPALIQRAESQMKAKESSVGSYMSKIKALDGQIDALIDGRVYKLQQGSNKVRQYQLKVVSDSMDFKAAQKQLDIAVKQYERTEELHAQGLKSLTDLENKRLKVQEMEAKTVSLENKLLTSRNELINARTELSSVNADYQDKISKSESEKSSALSSMYDAEATVTKMQNQIASYSIRSGYYYVTAPQDGYISQTLKNGVGETIKEGTALVSIVPSLADFAVEMYISPTDLPLVHRGNKVRMQFDGWPAIVFSGWPNVSYGTYGGIIIAVDNYIGTNGKYRILVTPDPKDHPWPKGLRMGVAVQSFTLLKDVPVWYELWRKINGFPPNYYTPAKGGDTAKKEKK